MARSNMCITVPVIILSTLTGSANFILNSIVGDDKQLQTYATIGIGGVSIFTGILTTLGNFFRYAQNSESNRVASIAWGKFQRQIQIELALHPRERIDSMDFLKICRAELDRMIEQSPAISDEIISQFEKEFKDKPAIKKPDIAHGVDHTQVFKDNDARLKKIAVDAAMMLNMKRKTLNEVIEPEMNRRIETRLKRIAADLSGSLLEELQRRTSELEQSIKKQAEASVPPQKKDGQEDMKLPIGATYLRSFSRGRAASINLQPPTVSTSKLLKTTSFVAPPPAPISTQQQQQQPSTQPPLTQLTVHETVPSETQISHQDLISALTERRQTFPDANFSMSFATDDNAVQETMEENQEAVVITVEEAQSKVETAESESV